MQGWIAIGVVVVLLLAFAAVRSRSAAWRAVRALVAEHGQTLARRRAQLVRIDDYGVEIDKAWRKEIDHFIDRVVLPRLRPGQQWVVDRHRPEIEDLVEERALSLPVRRAPPAGAVSGADFELECKEVLADCGWQARLTAASGDQGADIIARKDGATVALQCKRYSRPVGNKAVQEIAAARTYYGTDFAAVVSNADYTEAARRLAQRNDVHLLHIEDLPDLEDLLLGPENHG